MRWHEAPRRRGRLATVLLVVAGALTAAWGCSDDADVREAASTAGGSAIVEVGDNFFDPETVQITVGETVRWEWIGQAPHNVTADAFTSPTQPSGTFEHTFDAPGTYRYRCTLHPEMTGSVEVAAGPGPTDDGPTTAVPGVDTTAGATSTAGPAAPAAAVMTDPALRSENAVSGLDQPTSMAFIGDGEALVTEKATGKVRLIRDGQIAGDVLDLAVNFFDERGLLGIAVHPGFPAQPYVYLHWTWRGEGTGEAQLLGDDTDEATAVPDLGNRVDRFRWEADHLVFDHNMIEFRSNTLDTDTAGRVRGNHDAGPLVFGPDGKLYAMIGDQNLRGQLQNWPTGPTFDDLHFTGVIVRLNDDGTIPEDNPFYAEGSQMGNEVGDNLASIYAYGIRNSFGLAFEPRSGALWQTENGDDSFDEINVLPPGANSGWLQLQGLVERFDEYKEIEVGSTDGLDEPDVPPSLLAADADEAQRSLFVIRGSTYVAPVLSYVHPPALTAIGFVADERLGASSANTAWVGTVLTGAVLRYPVAPDGRSLTLDGELADRVDDNAVKGDLGESAPHVVGTGFGIVTDIERGPDGAVYIVSIDQGVIRRIVAS